MFENPQKKTEKNSEKTFQVTADVTTHKYNGLIRSNKALKYFVTSMKNKCSKQYFIQDPQILKGGRAAWFLERRGETKQNANAPTTGPDPARSSNS